MEPSHNPKDSCQGDVVWFTSGREKVYSRAQGNTYLEVLYQCLLFACILGEPGALLGCDGFREWEKERGTFKSEHNC